MREIRFRGKRIDNSEWVYGHYYEGAMTNNPMCLGDCRICRVIIVDGVFYHVIPETVGQCTGLKDKNSKEIYEGDIVEIVDALMAENTFVVEWMDGKECGIGFGMFSCFDHEIIGNIYENPDLLKEVNDGD